LLFCFNLQREEVLTVKALYYRLLAPLRGERGDQLTELGLILALIVVVAISALTGLGQKIVQVLQQAAGAI